MYRGLCKTPVIASRRTRLRNLQKTDDTACWIIGNGFSDVEKILKKAGGVFGNKGFIGTDYITTPIRKPKFRELLQWEHEWNNQVS